MKTEKTTVKTPPRFVAGVDVRVTALCKIPRGNAEIREALQAWAYHDLQVSIEVGKRYSDFLTEMCRTEIRLRPQGWQLQCARLEKAAAAADRAHVRSNNKSSRYMDFWVIRTYDCATDCWSTNPNYRKMEVAS